MPSRGSKSSAAARLRNMTQSTWASRSLRVKYQWPDGARDRLDSSPLTHASGKRRSSVSRTLRSNSATDKTRKPVATAPLEISFGIGVKSASEPTLIHTSGRAPPNRDRNARGSRFFCVTTCSSGEKSCSNFDRNRLWGLYNWLVTRHPVTIHKLIHRFLWISRYPLQARWARHFFGHGCCNAETCRRATVCLTVGAQQPK